MCACSPENKPYPRLHQKKWDQQGKGGDSHIPFHSCETSIVVVYSGLRSPTKERHGPVGVTPGHEYDQRAVAKTG